MADDDRSARLYLLDELPAAERRRFEDRYLADPELFARVEEAEAELLDDWTAGRLPPAQARRLDERYGASAEGRRRLTFARALRDRAAAAAGAGASPRSVPGAGRRGALAPLWAAAALTAAGLAVAAGIAWLAHSPSVAPEASPVVATLSLRPGLVRGGGAGAEIALPPGVEALELRLDAPAAIAYRATLETAEGRALWRGEGRAAAARGGASELVLRLPARELRSGDYVLALAPAGGDPPAAAAEYFFRVTPAR